MKRFRKWQRIFILSLLCFSVFAPIVLVSYRLKNLALEGPRDFVEDLSSIKYKADTLKLSAIEQEHAEDLKEPKQEVHKDQNFSIIRYSSDDRLKAMHTDNDRIRITSLGRKETPHHLKEENVKIRRKEAPYKNIQKKKSCRNLAKVQQSDVGMSQHDQSVISQPTRRSQNNHGSQLQKRMAIDETVKEMKDQLVRATAYLSFATTTGNIQLMKELKQRIKEVERAVGESSNDADLTKSAFSRMRSMGTTLLKVSRLYPDCYAMVTKLQEMAQRADEQIRPQRNQITFLTQLAGRTTPKGLHCLSMRLTTEYFAQPFEEREPANQLNFYNPDLFHYVVFSDNVLACAVVINSTISAAKEPEKIVFHVVTDSLNFPGISMWFVLNPPGRASIQVQSIDGFKKLSAKYGPIMVPNTDKENSLDPRYSSPLNHLRFYLPELFPHLDKIVFLDHDVVVLKDLSALWRVDMKGKVNGAVHTCHQGEPSYHRLDMLVNFSDPWIAENVDVNSCTWAFGMNLFDLREWRNQDLSAKYHRYLLMGSERPLWKPGSLPLGWVTFYNQTLPLDSNWHVLGLGHDAGIKHENIKQAAVIHYNGIMKPWLDIRIKRYKTHWTKHINFDHPYLQQCNIHG